MPASPRPTVPADFVQELTKLQSLVQELQRERQVEGTVRHSRRSPRGSPEDVEQISRNAIARFGDVFTTQVGDCPLRGWQGVVFGDGDSHRSGSLQ